MVDRRQRGDYIDALNAANDGDLRPLIRFFARLEGIALRSELIRPMEPAPAGAGAVEVARAHAERLRAVAWRSDVGHRERTRRLADQLHARLGQHLDSVRDQFLDAFRVVDPHAEAATAQAAPPDERARYWRIQLIRTANAVDFYTNLRDGSWWTSLRLTVFRQTLRYVVAVQKAGPGDTGMLTVTAFAELVDASPDTERSRPLPLLDPGPDDGVTLVYTDTADLRWQDVCDLVDRTLAAAVGAFGANLG